MSRNVTVGLDGSPESRAAAEWAAREAGRRGLPLRLLHVREPAPAPLTYPPPAAAAETFQDWADRIPREAADGIRLRHPGVEVAVELHEGAPDAVLTAAAGDAELLVLGSRGLGGLGGYLVGSVGLAVAARVERPVVFVRAGEQAADEHAMDLAGIPSAATGFRPVVLGLDADSPDDTVLAFAFEAAARRAAPLRAVHAWNLPLTTSTACRRSSVCTRSSPGRRPPRSPRRCGRGAGSTPRWKSARSPGSAALRATSWRLPGTAR